MNTLESRSKTRLNTTVGDEKDSRVVDKTDFGFSLAQRPSWLEESLYPFEDRYCHIDDYQIHSKSLMSGSTRRYNYEVQRADWLVEADDSRNVVDFNC
jgi:hypothetical protein